MPAFQPIFEPVSNGGGRALAILAYHKIGEPPSGGWPTWFYVPLESFAAHLACLRDADWQVIDVPTLLRGLDQPGTLPPRAAMITFDDGYRSNLQVALPLLKRFNYPAVMFVPTDYIGGVNDFDHGAEPAEAICDWDELRELGRGGVSIQSHGASHRGFSSLTPAEQQDELCRSKGVLEEGLGRPVDIISYPFGDGGEESADPVAFRRAVAEAGYRAACLYKGGVMHWPVENPHRLTRIAIGPDTDLRQELGCF